MPELPEVETMRRGILPIVGSTVSAVTTPQIVYRPIVMRPAIATLRKRLIGQVVTDVRRLGKRVLVDFDSKQTLVLQPKMAGLVSIENVPSDAHTRLIICFGDGPVRALKYWDRRGLGTIHLWSAEELAEQLDSRRLGPDALEIAFDDFYKRLSLTKREIKPALLEQATIAGIGNLYASEILHLAKIHPQARGNQLTKRQYRRMYEAMRKILTEAILYEGSTLSDGSYRNALNKDGQYQNSHRVYNRAEQLCLTCKKITIERIVQTQRSTFFCSICQRPNREPD